ncbi:MAG: S1 RNA-binding domain-containing protein [Anaerolineae bacterium]|nr:S1 RNA-binding domain-containing protein [Anaerolineae bacterium]
MNDQSVTGESHPMDALLDQYLSFGVPQKGDIRVGEIVANRNGVLLVDIGAKSEGIIPAEEVEQLDTAQNKLLALGKEIRVFVVDPEDEDGNIVLSYLKVAEEEDWKRVGELMKSGEQCECRVTGFNRGGLLVRLFNLRGFMPASQVGSAVNGSRGATSEQQYQSLIGTTMDACVLEADQARGRLILSAQEAEKSTRNILRQERMDNLQEGEIYEGEVINVTDFGAFVDIGEIEGLVHLSELSHKHVRRPQDVLSVGDHVKVSILNIDRERQRIALSMKHLEPDPWEQIEDLYQVGQLTQVTITQLAKYGAFARIDDDYRFEGLIHISELSGGTSAAQ